VHQGYNAASHRVITQKLQLVANTLGYRISLLRGAAMTRFGVEEFALLVNLKP
jgi:hypothetical protein